MAIPELPDLGRVARGDAEPPAVAPAPAPVIYANDVQASLDQSGAVVLAFAYSSPLAPATTPIAMPIELLMFIAKTLAPTVAEEHGKRMEKRLQALQAAQERQAEQQARAAREAADAGR